MSHIRYIMYLDWPLAPPAEDLIVAFFLAVAKGEVKLVLFPDAEVVFWAEGPPPCPLVITLAVMKSYRTNMVCNGERASEACAVW